MKKPEIPDFEEDNLDNLKNLVVIDERSGLPRFLSSCVHARRCKNCGRIRFVNVVEFVCKGCRKN